MSHMLNRIYLPVILALLAYGFFISPDFKQIAAGVAIFLFGMLFLEQGFGTFSGGFLERMLKKYTDRLWKSISFGIVTTSLMQSSSLVSVITISFLSAGLIGLTAGIGIIFGANLGTTTGAWLIAGLGLKVKISAYAMPMLVFGIVLVFQSTRTLKGIGYVLAGLGFLFLGIHYMKEGFEAFKDQIDLAQYAIGGFKGLVIYTLIGMAATVVMQSSHATLVLIITALAAHQITYENALSLAIGANIGTTITAIIGSLSANHQGKRLALSHLLFNVVTAAIALVFIRQIMVSVEWISREVGIAADDFTLKLAVFHTIFNLIGVLIMTPFINQLVRFVSKVFPAKVPAVTEPKYLSDSVLEFPETLLEATYNEVRRLYNKAAGLMLKGLHLQPSEVYSAADLEKLVRRNSPWIEFDYDEEYATNVKPLYSAIVAFISRAEPSTLTPAQAEHLYRLRDIAADIVETVKDVKHLRKNITRYIRSDNEHIRDEYNAIRYRLAALMKELYEMQQADIDEGEALLTLNQYRVEFEEHNIIADGRLERYIRDHLIDPTMATSLMNDKVYEKDAIENLIQVGSGLIAARDPEAREAAEAITLDAEEIEAVAKAANE